MEKIQAAIAKARASRQTQAETEVPPLPSRAAPADETAVTRAWAALDELQLDPATLAEHHVITLTGGPAVAPFDTLRTRVLQQLRGQGWRRLALTSPGPGCGKSTLSLNLAFSLARQSNLRIVLAELDLRRPSLARLLGLDRSHSFAHVLDGRSTFAENAVRCGANLAIATNRGPSRAPSELLQGPGVAGILAGIEADYAPDVMLFDLPPLLVNDDAMAFLGQSDCAILVAASEVTTLVEIDQCEREIASHTNVMGVVLNKCRYGEKDYGYGY